MTNDYAAVRDQEIKRVGLGTQLKAEAHLDKHAESKFKTYYESGTGKKVRYRKIVGDRLLAKGKVELSKTISVPSAAYRDGWERIFGGK